MSKIPKCRAKAATLGENRTVGVWGRAPARVSGRVRVSETKSLALLALYGFRERERDHGEEERENERE